MRAFIDFLDPAHAAAPNAGADRPRLRARFAHPVAVLRADALADVNGVLQQVQAHALAGRWCVGAVAYEAAPAFDPALPTHAPAPGWPLAQFAVYDQALAWPLPDPRQPPPAGGAQTTPWESQPASPGDYTARVRQAQAAMAAGECYQINLTQALYTQFAGAGAGGQSGQGDAAALTEWFERLRQAQPAAYVAWLDWGAQQVMSLSPELFFDWRPDGARGWLTCQPMKGTAPRHADARQDAQASQDLRDSHKERAENVMIVDLLRNDMGRLAETGSVQVSRLFDVQALPTVWQMTTTVQARTRPGVDLPALFAALFPCGSVTGAPKARAMHWIQTLETAPRGVYCGAVGVVRPGGAATFNVPIRTLALSRQADHPASANPPSRPTPTQAWAVRCGVGSAITVYAEPEAEWQELAAKTRFLARAQRPFSLLETLRLEGGCYWLLPEHLSRLAASAAYFKYAWHPDAVQDCLDALAQRHPVGTHRVRLTLDVSGHPQAEAFVLEPTPEPVLFNVCELALAAQGHDHEFIVHKTTRRDHYDSRLRPHPGVFDTLLCNARGEVTEFTRGNLAVRINGRWLTPALACGLLPGTYRSHLLAQGELHEAVLTLADVRQAEAVAFFNSLRGWLQAQPHPQWLAGLPLRV